MSVNNAQSKLKVAYPILLVVAGLLFSLIPGIPKITINPDVIFLIFLPPILYEAATSNSWKELWRWRRIITSFAFIVVFITASVVAFIANHFIPGFSIPLGFLLGGIVSPPDAVSAAAIMKFVKVPRRISAILEGESLFNDASSLIIIKFALISVGIGQFVWYDAAGNFLWMVVGGVAVGIATSYVFNKLHSWLPMDENINIIFSLVTPYVMYLMQKRLKPLECLLLLAVAYSFLTEEYYFSVRLLDYELKMCGALSAFYSTVLHFF